MMNYRAVRFFLFDFSIRRLDDAAPKKREIEAAETHLNLIRDIRESIRVYMDKMGRLEFFPALPTKPSKLDEYMKGVRVLEMAYMSFTATMKRAAR
jgi:hypothetical protein